MADRDLERELERKMKLIDDKLKEAFSSIKKDIHDLKSGSSGGLDSGEFESLREDIDGLRKELASLNFERDSGSSGDERELESLRSEIEGLRQERGSSDRNAEVEGLMKELERLRHENEIAKAVSSEKRKADELKQKLEIQKERERIVREEIRKKEREEREIIGRIKEIEKTYADIQRGFEKRQEEISEKYSAIISGLDRQFSSSLKSIQKENERILKENEKLLKNVENRNSEIVGYYDSKFSEAEQRREAEVNELLERQEEDIKAIEKKRAEEIKEIRKLYEKEAEVLENRQKLFERTLLKKQAESDKGNANFMSSISEIIKAQEKQSKERMKESEQRFERLVREIEKRRGDDVALILRGISDVFGREKEGDKVNLVKSRGVRDGEREVSEGDYDELINGKTERETVTVNKGSSSLFGFVKNLVNGSGEEKGKEGEERKGRVNTVKSSVVHSKTKAGGTDSSVDGKRGDKGIWTVIPYIFLFILALLAVNQYFKWDVVTAWNWQIVVLGIATGGATFWKNRDRIEDDLDREKKKEELDEEIRKREFASKYPRINKVPVVRSLVK
ncbi:MAG: hypothetical protein Q8P81_02560, partial [Nanoarchaeota archaeon]|nr:hypothetical protein [Nanoarchaeota archaeon]